QYSGWDKYDTYENLAKKSKTELDIYIEENRSEIERQVWNEAKYLNTVINLETMNGDYISAQISIGEGVKAFSIGCIVDKEGNVYAVTAFSPGVSVGIPLKTGVGYLSNHEDNIKKVISGYSGSLSAVAGIGGTIGVGEASIIAEFNVEAGVDISGSIGYTWYLGTLVK
ncbi:hypothetical protein, partial [Veillonella sp. R32]|uniref:hypothetical protein n=1 Tax=Veillonella sp. R32 TaxID=2021312 RepID=UPI00138A2437